MSELPSLPTRERAVFLADTQRKSISAEASHTRVPRDLDDSVSTSITLYTPEIFRVPSPPALSFLAPVKLHRQVHADPPGRQTHALLLVHAHARVVALQQGRVGALGGKVGGVLAGLLDGARAWWFGAGRWLPELRPQRPVQRRRVVG